MKLRVTVTWKPSRPSRGVQLFRRCTSRPAATTWVRLPVDDLIVHAGVDHNVTVSDPRWEAVAGSVDAETRTPYGVSSVNARSCPARSVASRPSGAVPAYDLGDARAVICTPPSQAALNSAVASTTPLFPAGVAASRRPRSDKELRGFSRV